MSLNKIANPYPNDKKSNWMNINCNDIKATTAEIDTIVIEDLDVGNLVVSDLITTSSLIATDGGNIGDLIVVRSTTLGGVSYPNASDTPPVETHSILVCDTTINPPQMKYVIGPSIFNSNQAFGFSVNNVEEIIFGNGDTTDINKIGTDYIIHRNTQVYTGVIRGAYGSALASVGDLMNFKLRLGGIIVSQIDFTFPNLGFANNTPLNIDFMFEVVKQTETEDSLFYDFKVNYLDTVSKTWKGEQKSAFIASFVSGIPQNQPFPFSVSLQNSIAQEFGYERRMGILKCDFSAPAVII